MYIHALIWVLVVRITRIITKKITNAFSISVNDIFFYRFVNFTYYTKYEYI